MEKIRVWILLSFLTAGNLYSQYFDGGIAGGFSASQIDGDSYSGFNKLGLVGGGWVSRALTGSFSGQLELRYIGKGAYYSDNEGPITVYYKRILHYTDMPVVLNYHYRERILLNIGLSPEYLIKHILENADGIDPDDELSYNDFTMSGLLGMGYTFLDKLTFSVRYNYSIIPLSPHRYGQTYRLNRGYYNNVLTIALYYRISLQ